MIERILKKVKERREDSSKFDHGHLLVVGGSSKYSGSPAFNSLAAYRSGVDLVTTAAPQRSANVIATYSPSLITVPLDGDFLSPTHYEEIRELVKEVDALVIGGGLERRKQTNKTVVKILEQAEIPAVVDADGIRAVADDTDALDQETVVTPHTREFKVLTGMEASEENAEEAANEMDCTVLLKGEKDVVTDGEDTYTNRTGNEYMTVGGTGDTLAGVVGSLLAQNLETIKAAYGGAWINGKAGELAADEREAGVMPDDIIEKIPEAIQQGK
ncbi:MAG: NAD(P)H-hydrate dehydratase [Candidatus Aenigmatarchaeota archaeon]